MQSPGAGHRRAIFNGWDARRAEHGHSMLRRSVPFAASFLAQSVRLPMRGAMVLYMRGIASHTASRAPSSQASKASCWLQYPCRGSIVISSVMLPAMRFANYDSHTLMPRRMTHVSLPRKLTQKTCFSLWLTHAMLTTLFLLQACIQYGSVTLILSDIQASPSTGL